MTTQHETQQIAFLGTGRMGAPMAANLARAGFGVRAWNRTPSHAAALIDEGVTVAASPAEAVRGAGILITMLADGPATEQAWDGPGGLAGRGPRADLGPDGHRRDRLDGTAGQQRGPVRGALLRCPGLRQPGTGSGRRS